MTEHAPSAPTSSAPMPTDAGAATAVLNNANGRVSKAGDTMTGQLNCPVFAVDANGYLTVSGGTTVVQFDANDALHYTRSNNTASLIIGGAAGIGRIGGSAVESMARQPEASGQISTAMIITAALIEGATLFAVVVGLLASL